jgi:hypothetical protein
MIMEGYVLKQVFNLDEMALYHFVLLLGGSASKVYK